MRRATSNDDEGEFPSLEPSVQRVERDRTGPIANFYDSDERRRFSTEKRLVMGLWVGDGSRYGLLTGTPQAVRSEMR